MSDSYAKALVDLAEEKSQLEPIHADVDAISAVLKDNGKLKDMLFNPIVDSDKKTEVLGKIAREAGFNKYTQNFLNLLVKKDRIDLLDQICESFEEQYCVLTDTQVIGWCRAGLGRTRHGLQSCRRGVMVMIALRSGQAQ